MHFLDLHVQQGVLRKPCRITGFRVYTKLSTAKTLSQTHTAHHLILHSHSTNRIQQKPPLGKVLHAIFSPIFRKNRKNPTPWRFHLGHFSAQTIRPLPPCLPACPSSLPSALSASLPFHPAFPSCSSFVPISKPALPSCPSVLPFRPALPSCLPACSSTLPASLPFQPVLPVSSHHPSFSQSPPKSQGTPRNPHLLPPDSHRALLVKWAKFSYKINSRNFDDFSRFNGDLADSEYTRPSISSGGAVYV